MCDMVSKRLVVGIMSLHLIAGCTAGNGRCKTSFGHGWACPPSWYQWGGKCYKATAEPLTWFEAKEECIKMGSVLAVPLSPEETDFLVQFVPGAVYIWIDCNDLQNEGTWECRDGVEYRNWKPQQPDNYGDEDCSNIWREYGQWNDGSCSYKAYAVCTQPTPRLHL